MKKSSKHVVMGHRIQQTFFVKQTTSYRWYSLEDHSSSSGGFGVVGFVIGLACVVF